MFEIAKKSFWTGQKIKILIFSTSIFHLRPLFFREKSGYCFIPDYSSIVFCPITVFFPVARVCVLLDVALGHLMSNSVKNEKNEKITILIFWPVQNDFLAILKKSIFRHVFQHFVIFFCENLQKSIKSDVSDTNGCRESDFQVEISPNDTVKIDFRSTVTHFMICFRIFIKFCVA